MQSIECEGETIDEAIENALRELGADRDRVEVEILADATRGVFGFGGKPARIRARIRAPLDLEHGAARVSRETTQPGKEPAGSPRGETRPRPPAPPARPAAPPARVSAPAARPAATTASIPPPRPAEDAAPRPVPEALAARATEVLRDMLSLLGTQCQVAARSDSDSGSLLLQVTGDSSGLLIGRRGATLDALEYLVNRIVSRGDDRLPARVMIDVEHYRERRREYLDSLARRLADKAKESGHVVTLNPMSPRDRRIVHLALQGDSAVATRSQGDGYYRKVLILPAARAARPPSPPRERT